MYKNVVSGTFGATGNGNDGTFTKYFNLTISGTFVATVVLERSFDQGATWVAVAFDTAGTTAQFTTAISLTGYEPENGVRYRLRCSSYSSGTVNYRISQ